MDLFHRGTWVTANLTGVWGSNISWNFEIKWLLIFGYLLLLLLQFLFISITRSLTPRDTSRKLLLRINFKSIVSTPISELPYSKPRRALTRFAASTSKISIPQTQQYGVGLGEQLLRWSDVSLQSHSSKAQRFLSGSRPADGTVLQRSPLQIPGWPNLTWLVPVEMSILTHFNHMLIHTLGYKLPECWIESLNPCFES